MIAAGANSKAIDLAHVVGVSTLPEALSSGNIAGNSREPFRQERAA